MNNTKNNKSLFQIPLILIGFIFLILFLFPRISFAYQFSECNVTNQNNLEKHLSNLIDIYPEDIKKKIKENQILNEKCELSYDDIKIVDRNIYRGQNKLQGIMVNYFLHKREDSLEQFEKDLILMKKEGIIGVALEVPWFEYETSDNNFSSPVYIDKALSLIEENKMYATILLSPHYTPEWLYEKLGDVYMYTADQKKIVWNNLSEPVPEAGAYLTFSPFSKMAIEEQIEFQSNAVQYYEKRKSVIAIFLSNEQTYPKYLTADYSSHAEKAWKTFSNKHNLIDTLPINKKDSNYKYFERFLQQGLNSFHQEIIDRVSITQKTSVPIAHRMMMYDSMSEYADQFHHKPSSTEINSSILVNDIYGFTPNVFALQYSFNRPTIIAETTMLGSCNKNFMHDYLLFQFLHGSSILTIFKWERGIDDYSLLNLDGSYKEKALGVFSAAKKIQNLKNISYPESKNYLFIPQDSILDFAYNNKRYNIDKRIEDFWSFGVLPSLFFSDAFLPDLYQLEKVPVKIKDSMIFIADILSESHRNRLLQTYSFRNIISLVNQIDLYYCQNLHQCIIPTTFKNNIITSRKDEQIEVVKTEDVIKETESKKYSGISEYNANPSEIKSRQKTVVEENKISLLVISFLLLLGTAIYLIRKKRSYK